MSRTILITGANGGLGSALAEQLIENAQLMPDCRFVLQHRKLKETPFFGRSDAFKRKLQDYSTWYQADLTDEAQARDMVDFAGSWFTGYPLAGIVCLAGGNQNALIESVSNVDFQSVMDQNVLTMHNVARAAIAEWREDGAGDDAIERQIVTVSSVVATKGAPGATPYAAAKAAIEGYTRSLALEVARYKIHVNCIRLGYFDAGLIRDVPESMHDGIKKRIAMRRFGDPGVELANVVRFLLDGNNYMTGQVLPVDGGML